MAEEHGKVHDNNDINNSDLNNKIEILSGFDIINGYEDGTFKPNNAITRAEFSKIIVNAIFADNSESDNVSFTDVSGSHWAKDYIHIAKSLGIVNGIDESNFAPNDNITYEQAIKMIVAALGYDEEAQSKGGYPNGYINIAKSLGITNGLSYSNTDKATRGDIAIMIYNALGVDYYSIWNEDGEVKRMESKMTLLQLHRALEEINREYVEDDFTESAVG